MFAIDEKTTVPDYEKLPLVPEDSEVIVYLTVAKDVDGLKGRYAIFEGKVAEVIKGNLTKGEAVKALMVQVDDQRRIMKNQTGGVTNYAIIEVIKFLETIAGEPFPKDKLNEAVTAMCTDIGGMAVRIIARKNVGDEKQKPFTERKFAHVPNQDLKAQREALKAL